MRNKPKINSQRTSVGNMPIQRFAVLRHASCIFAFMLLIAAYSPNAGKAEELPVEKPKIEGVAAENPEEASKEGVKGEGEASAKAAEGVASEGGEPKHDSPKGTLSIVDVKIKRAGKFTKAEIITSGDPAEYKVSDVKSPNGVAIEIDGVKRTLARNINRVVVDIGNVNRILAKKNIKVSTPHIMSVKLGRYDGSGRVVFNHKGDIQPYDVVKEKDRVVIFFGKGSEITEAKVVKIDVPEALEAEKTEAEEAPSEETKESEKAPVEKTAKKIETKKALGVIDIKVEKVAGFTKAQIITNGKIESYNIKNLSSPDRVVVDINNAGRIYTKKSIKVSSTHIKGVRLGKDDGRIRVVFDYKGNIKPYDVVKEEDRVVIYFGRKPKEDEKAAEAQVNETESARPEAPKEKAEVGAPSEPVAAKPEVEAAEDRPETKAALPKEEAKREVPKEEVKARVEAKVEKKAEIVNVPAVEEVKPETAEKRYTGQKVTLEFKDADIKNVFRVIAEVSGYNMIIGEEVKGRLTLRLVNVPWDQALDIILETNNLGMTKVGNVIRVNPLTVIKKGEEDKLAATKAKEKMEDLVTKLIAVSYAKATDISGKIKSVMTDRGTVTMDDRTNTIILKDIQKSVDDAVKLVASLDTPTPQVLIEARIVEANTNFTRDLGVQWGASHAADAAHGNPTGYYFPNSYNITAGGGGAFVLNPPAAGSVGPTGGTVGISFGSINNTLNLDLRLSALETQGWGKVVSSPKILTLDNKEASISQGLSIPFETTSASGTQTTFVDANLNLTVTPHVTADGRLMMKIKATKNAPSLAFKGASGAPSIDKKEASTEILLKDGETTVIGGIYQTSKGESESFTPFLGRIPIIGWLFKSKSVSDTKTELLIFITPRIVRETPA